VIPDNRTTPKQLNETYTQHHTTAKRSILVCRDQIKESNRPTTRLDWHHSFGLEWIFVFLWEYFEQTLIQPDVKKWLNHSGAKYDTQSSEDHTSTSNDVCYLGSTHCGPEETFKTRAWYADSLHKKCSTWCISLQIKTSHFGTK